MLRKCFENLPEAAGNSPEIAPEEPVTKRVFENLAEAAGDSPDIATAVETDHSNVQ